MLSKDKTAYIFLILTTLFWSGNFIVGKAASAYEIPPFTLNFYRWLFAGLILLPFTIKEILQKNSVNKAIKLVKMGKVKEAEIALRAAVKYLIRKKCKKIILGCTELPIAIFAYKSFRKAKESKLFIDPNLLLAEVCMKKYKR